MPLNQKTWAVQSGATLIEVMIALLILAVGLLGFAAMETQGLVAGRKAFLSSQAQLLAEDMAERIRANSPTLIAVSSYAMTEGDNGSDKGCDAASCTTSDITQWDEYRWKTRLRNELPSGNGSIAVNIGANPYATVTITVSYAIDKDVSATEKAANKSTYVLSTQINPPSP